MHTFLLHIAICIWSAKYTLHTFQSDSYVGGLMKPSITYKLHQLSRLEIDVKRGNWAKGNWSSESLVWG